MDKQVGSDEGQPRRAARERTFRRYAHINKQLLTELYYEQGLTVDEIARQLGLGSRNTVTEYMEEFGIPRRKSGPVPQPIAKEVLEELYIRQGMSTVDIGKRLRVSFVTVLRNMRSHGIERRERIAASQTKSRIHNLHEDYFATVDDHDKAYIIGFILGDGVLLNYKDKGKRLVIKLQLGDAEFLEDMANYLGIEPASVQRCQDEHTSYARLQVSSTRIVNDLVALGVPMGNKTFNEPFIDFADTGYNWAFVRGLFDSDGCVRVVPGSHGGYKRLDWTVSIGLSCISGLRYFLEQQGIRLSPKCITRPNTGRIDVYGKTNLLLLRSQLYKYGSLWLLRKKHIFDTLA